MGKAHIRDFMELNKDKFLDGKVSTVAMCGESDPDMNKLCFGDPKSIVEKKIDHCEKCRNRWLEEANSLKGGQKEMMSRFRKLVHGAANLTRFGKSR